MKNILQCQIFLFKLREMNVPSICITCLINHTLIKGFDL